jgi:hypothetical protein
MTIPPATILDRWRRILDAAGHAAFTSPVSRALVEATLAELERKDEQIAALRRLALCQISPHDENKA